MKTRTFRSFALLFALVAFTGCSATEKIVSQWSNPAYASLSFKRIIVIGVSGQTSIRRNFEDLFVAQLKAAGYGAVPSYRYVAEDEKFEQAKLKQTAQAAGADGAIVTRLAHVEHRTEVSPGYCNPFPAFGFYGWSSFA